MKTFVLDASVAAARLLKHNPEADRILALLEGENKALVPGLWHLETRNSLIVGMRRKQLSVDWCGSLIGALDRLPVHTNHQPDLEAAFSLAVKHRLTFYDAVYLELAKRHDVPIATFDNAMAKGAVAEGLSLISNKAS